MNRKWPHTVMATGLALVVFFLLPTCTVSSDPTPTPAPQGLLFEHGFETGDLSGFFWHANAPQVVTVPQPVRAGAYAMRSYLQRYNSPHSSRTEVIMAQDPRMPPDQRIEAFSFDIGQEYWIGFSIFIPDGFVTDIEDLSDVVFQIQAMPDKGETYRSPILALDINEDRWVVTSRWDPRADSPPQNRFEGESSTDVGSIIPATGRWTDWVINAKWSWQKNGFVRVWRNGKPVLNRKGPNCSNDQRGPFLQMGLYKWPWAETYFPSNTNERLVYHDELRIGGANSSYRQVAPPQTRRATYGLRALYTFEERTGTIFHDYSRSGRPLSLVVDDISATSRRPGVLSIDSPAVLSSLRPATDLVEACQDSNEITLEAWIMPRSTGQDGPARIMSLGSSIYSGNFSLEQGSSEKRPSNRYRVWLRTTDRAESEQGALSSAPGSPVPEMRHIVYTRAASGKARIYVNNEVAANGSVVGDFSDWRGTSRLTVGNDATGQQPWLGELHLLALYCRALDSSDVRRNFLAGPAYEPPVLYRGGAPEPH
jgi:hypothetical protein